MPTQKTPHGGHRQRILTKLQNDCLTEHEYLEVLLFHAMPRKNTNDLAHRLLSRFGSLPAVFEASMAELCEVDGIGESVASYLFCLGKFNQTYYRAKKKNYEGKYSPLRFAAHLGEQFQPKDVETVEVYYVDEQGYVTAQDAFRGLNNTTIIDSNEFAQLLAKRRPAGIVLAHNHPSGRIQPSARDEEMTKRVQLVCGSHNVIFLDHIFLGEGGVYSYYLSGEMQKISKAFSMDSLIRLSTEGKE